VSTATAPLPADRSINGDGAATSGQESVNGDGAVIRRRESGNDNGATIRRRESGNDNGAAISGRESINGDGAVISGRESVKGDDAADHRRESINGDGDGVGTRGREAGTKHKQGEYHNILINYKGNIWLGRLLVCMCAYVYCASIIYQYILFLY